MRSIFLLILSTALAMAGAPIHDARLSGETTVTGTLTSSSGATVNLNSGTLLLHNPSAVFGGDSGEGGTIGLVPAPASGDAAAGRVLGADGTWVLAASSLASLQDAAISSPVSGEILTYSGTEWINAPAPAPIADLGDLSDVILTAPVNGDVLTFSGTEWIAVPGGGAGGGGIIDPTIAPGDIVVRNATTVGRLPVGDDGDHLIADSTAPTGLRWAVNAGVDVIAARLYRSTTQNIPGGTLTAIEFNANWYATPGTWSASTNPSRFTVPAGGGGYYMIAATIGYAQAPEGNYRYIALRLNGGARLATQVAASSAPSFGPYVNVSTVAHLVPGDYIEVEAFHNSTGSLSSIYSEQRCPVLSIVRIAP